MPERKRQKEAELVGLMIDIYCKKNHKVDGCCKECSELKEYAKMRIEKCPYMEEKTFCSSCKNHCYAPSKREEIRRVMRFSGPRMIFHHPILAIKHAIDTLKNRT